MCGIVGVFEHGRSRGAVSREVLVRMRETLHHRGPDGEGVYVTPDGRVGLAHRRLAIVDVEHGAQPMFGPGGTCLVFNGEIYNYPELRRRLEAEGTRFQTRCDTEVILHLYARHGEACVDHLTGMFAFAIWDPARECLFFARDPIGEKPLYWLDVNGVFAFASEIKALLAHPSVRRAVNEEAIGPYLANLVTPGPETLYRDISKLPPGCMGRCDARGVVVSPYWNVTRAREWTEPGADPARRVRELLDASVQARLMSDVPVGVMLSGGLDSSAIVALLRDRARDLASFTVGYPDHEGYDERAEARFVAERFGTDHHEIVLTEEDTLAALAPMVHHQDEPLADPVCVPVHAICGRARELGIKVLLAGEGSDELFWGYSGYRGVIGRWPRYRAVLRLPSVVRRLAVHTASATRAARRREQLEGIASGRVRPIHMPLGLTEHQRRHLLRSRSPDAGWSPGEAPAGDPLSTLVFDTQQYEFEVRLPELLLMRVDRFSMANGVEARVPFLDPALVEYVYGLPLDLKLSDGVTKRVLKEALADAVPDRIAHRKKQGFAAPTSSWFARRHGVLLRNLMRQDALRAYFDTDYLEGLLATVDPTTWESGGILWPILNFGLWHKYWIEDEPIDALVDEMPAAA